MKNYLISSGRRSLVATAVFAILAGCGSDNDNPPGANQPPQAQDFEVITVIGEPTDIAVLEQVSDPENGRLSLTSVQLLNGVGEARVDGDYIVFESNAFGSAQLEYSVMDDHENSASATVDIDVKASLVDYVGTETCLGCHKDKSGFKETGHNFKFNKVIDGQMPDFPFTTMEGVFEHLEGVENSAGTPTSFADISYVLGGYQRQAILLDKNGYMVNGTKAMVDVVPKGQTIGADDLVPFKPDTGADSSPYTCGTCHNTGWRDFTSETGDQRNRHRQDGLIGMEGTFNQTGVQCEACHGAGGDHAKSPSSKNITRVAEGRSRAQLTAMNMAYGEPVACGECHTKEGERHYPSYQTPYNAEFGGDTIGGRYVEYFEEGRTAGDALLAIDPDSGEPVGRKRHLHCADCHDPHLSTNFSDKPGHGDALIADCQDCHGDKQFTEGATAVHGMVAECADCHMPINSHLFKIDLSEPSDSEHHFSKDGRFRKPWLRASQSCQACHANDYDDRASRVVKMHR